MQCVILAAGRGSRLSPITDNTPKPLIEVNGTPLIMNALNIVSRHKVERFIVVVGYKAQAVRQALGTSWGGVDIVYVENEEWDKTNNIYSLWLTRDYWDHDTLLLECDVFFEHSLMDDLLAQPFTNAALVDAFQPHMDGTVVEISPDKKIIRMIPGKDQHKDFDFTGKYKTVNIYCFTREYLAGSFLPILELYLRLRGKRDYYELVLGVLLFMGDTELHAHICAPHRWFEIDDFTDLQRAEAHVCDTATLLDKVRNCHGGYWRYDFIDFAYLYNPYFPPTPLQNELRLNLPKLLSNYPSGLLEINKALANWVKLDEARLAVGNGGAELIAALRGRIGKVAFPAPGFNEYERGLAPHQLLPLSVDPLTMRLSPEQLVRQVKAGKADTLVLINPNNPTGAAYSREELRAILRGLAGRARVILDESFADFMDEEHQASMLGELVLYPHLVILRSLSKDLGVPGLRLGYVATDDRQLIGEIREQCPIWHVNSLAQYFLDILPKYRGEYADSLRRSAEARRQMRAALETVEGVTVFPSQANFFMLRLPPGVTSSRLQEILFHKRRLYVKDLGAKSGLEPESFIRVAVKTDEENAMLVAALREVLGAVNEARPRVAA